MSQEVATEEQATKRHSPVEASNGWRLGMRQLLSIVFYCALAFWLLRLIPSPVLAASVLLIVVGSVTFSVLLARMATQRDMLLAVLALAAERDLPLAPALEAISDQLRGRLRRAASALAARLHAGAPLAVALDESPTVFSPEAELLARVGYEVGRLGPALREAESTRRARPSLQTAYRLAAYWCWVLFIVQTVSVYVFYFITPKYEAVLRDFGVATPPLTAFLFEIGRGVVGPWAPVFAAAASLEFLGFCLAAGWSVGLPSPSNFVLVNQLFVRRHSALILRSLALAVDGNRPLTRGFEQLAAWYPTPSVRRRLEHVLLDVKHGTDWLESMVHHRLLRRADAAVLDAARRTGNLAWALRETAQAGERRQEYRLQAVMQVLYPLVLIALGLLVGLMAVAYFVPLINVIEVLL